jgi:DNA-binding MarR family transcriptional regulator
MPQGDDKAISLLELLKNNPDAGQRDMAEAIGLSLGMTNMLLKELSARGWMMMRRLTARKVQYWLTPEGLKELSRRSYRFLKKSIHRVAECRVRLEFLVLEVKRLGSRGVWLIGNSDVDFVLDYLCRQHGVAFCVSAELNEEGWFKVYGENETLTPNILDFMEFEKGEVRL